MIEIAQQTKSRSVQKESCSRIAIGDRHKYKFTQKNEYYITYKHTRNIKKRQKHTFILRNINNN